ncbi:MAG: nuclear transport factor 2 family protein [Sphingomicrobium sp.]
MPRWTTGDEAVRRASEDAEIAAVLEQSNRAMAAITSRDVALFAALQAPELRVNSPINRVLTGDQATQGMAAGMIDYETFERTIDYVGKVPGGLVVVMGDETFVPRGRAANAGKRVQRRFTDVWRMVEGDWKLAIRQATVIGVGEVEDREAT